MHNTAYALVLASSIALTAWNGVDYVSDAITPPVIEGWAERKAPVIAGETIRLEWHIIKRTECEGVVGLIWAGENGFRMSEPIRAASLPMTHVETAYRFSTKIPGLAPVGDLELFIKGWYDCPHGKEYYSLGPVELIVEVAK